MHRAPRARRHAGLRCFGAICCLAGLLALRSPLAAAGQRSGLDADVGGWEGAAAGASAATWSRAGAAGDSRLDGEPGPGANLAWLPMGPDGGSIRFLAHTPALPQTVYAVSSEDGVFRSLDGGRHWSLVSEELPGVTCLAIDPRDARTVYAGSGSGVWKSTDGGITWRQASVGFEPLAAASVSALAIDSSDSRLVYASSSGNSYHTIYRSTDAGASWSPAPHQPYIEGPVTLVSDPTRPGTLYLGAGNGLFASRDYGRRWFPVGGGFPQGHWSGAVALAPDGTLYAITGFGADVVDRSFDGGTSWSAGAKVEGILQLAAAADGGLFGVDDYSRLFHSADRGSSWTSVPQPSFFLYPLPLAAQLVVDTPSPGGLLIASRDGVFGSADGGGSWAGASQGLRAAAVEALAAAPGAPAQPSTIYGVFTPGTLKWSRRPGPGWIAANPVAVVEPARALAVDPSRPQTIWVGDGQTVLTSRDGGTSWEATAPLPSRICSVLGAIAVAPMRPRTVYLAGYEHGPFCDSTQTPSSSFRTTDGGRSWEPMPIDGFGLAVDPVEPEALCVFGSALACSTDGGATWTRAAGPDGLNGVIALAIDPRDTRQIYAASFRGLLASRNRGRSFHAVDGLPAGPAVGVALDARTDPSTLFVAIGAGVFSSADGGATWSPLGTGLPRGLYLLLVDPAAPDTLYAGTGHGVYRLQRPPLAP